MSSQRYEMNENHWRIPDDQGVHGGPSKSDVDAVRRWKIATTFVFLVALVAFGVAIVALAELKNQKPPEPPKDEPKTSMQIMSVNQSLLLQTDQLQRLETSINDLRDQMVSQNGKSKLEFVRVNATAVKTQSHMQDLSKSILGTQSHLSSVENSVNSLINSVKRVSERLSSENRTSADRAKSFQSNFAQQASELTKLQKSLQNASRQINAAQSRINALVIGVNSLSSNNSKLQDRINFLFDTQSVDLADLRKTVGLLNQTLAGATEQLSERVEDIRDNFANTTSGLQKDAKALETRVATNEKDITQLKKDIGWTTLFNGYEYLLKRSGNNFNDSRTFCKNRGGDLATVGLRSNETRKYITDNIFPVKTRYSIWIGLTDLSVEGKWYWIDNVRATDANTDFIPGEPNNYKGKQDCSYMHKFSNGYQMADYYCTSLFSALCERRITY